MRTCLPCLPLVYTTLLFSGCSSSPNRIELFDGHSLNGWSGPGPWQVQEGAIVYPPTGRLEESLVASQELEGPLQVSLEIQLIGRRNEDGRGFWLKSAEHEIHVRVDNSPNEFSLTVVPDRYDVSRRHPLSEDEWYLLSCRVDANGQIRAWLNGSNELRSTWLGTFPITLGIECQRSGGRFRNIVVTRTAP